MKPRVKRSTGRMELGKYIVADPQICHGQPTFKGTRVLVWVVLEQLADGMSWDAIVKEWRGPKAAIAEAAALASELVKQRGYRGLNDHHRRKPARMGDLQLRDWGIRVRAAAEVRVLGKWRGKSFEKSFLADPDLATALKAAKSFIAEQTK